MNEVGLTGEGGCPALLGVPKLPTGPTHMSVTALLSPLPTLALPRSKIALHVYL